MAEHPLAGHPVPTELLIDVPALVTSYYTLEPDPANAVERVSFGTSGHRGSSLKASFNEAHIIAVTQAICDYREEQGFDGPLYLGKDSHALSEPAHATALEVLAGNGVTTFVQENGGLTPTPVISHAILSYNAKRQNGLADGIVITPSHNPPEDGGFKYNPPHGGPAGSEETRAIEARANRYLEAGMSGVSRVSLRAAFNSEHIQQSDLQGPYVDDLGSVLDMEAIRGAGLKIGVDPLGGASAGIWQPISERWGFPIEIVNPFIDPTFRFMSVDRDGKIRMDCSSRFAMAGLIGLSRKFDIAFGNDPDADRHGIVTPGHGLLNPNHYLSVAVNYLFSNRPDWSRKLGVGKTLVSTSMLDRVAASLGRSLLEVPVGFKWFVPGLRDGLIGFGGEESAGASFLKKNGQAWSTDKDGILLNLLAAEILARTGKDPGDHYRELCERFGDPVYERTEASASVEQKRVLAALSPEAITDRELAGEPILAKLVNAPGNGASIGGLKIVTENGWFAARPSGTEDIYKIYAESFRGLDHLKALQNEAQQLVSRVFQAAGLR